MPCDKRSKPQAVTIPPVEGRRHLIWAKMLLPHSGRIPTFRVDAEAKPEVYVLVLSPQDGARARRGEAF